MGYADHVAGQYPELRLPSFSIVVETANLRTVDHQRLIAALDSLESQSLSPALARAVLVLDGDEAPPALLELILARYPWISVRPIPSGTDYGDQKSMAVSLTSSEIVVFADSDCLYDPDWLGAFLETFATRPDIGIIAGETTLAITGPFTLAMALVFFFPRFSYETEAVLARGFYGNNVAFRREVLTRCPFPSGLPIHRGQNVIYSRLLRAAGISIWRQPRARAVHSPPEGIGPAIRCFFRAGRDIPRIARMEPPPMDAPFQGDCEPYHSEGGRVRKVIERIRAISSQQPRMLLLLPVALPIAFACVVAFFLGIAIERASPSTADFRLETGHEAAASGRQR